MLQVIPRDMFIEQKHVRHSTLKIAEKMKKQCTLENNG